MVRARVRAPRTRSPRSGRKNGCLLIGKALSRTGKDKFEWAERTVATVSGQGGWYRGATRKRASSLWLS